MSIVDFIFFKFCGLLAIICISYKQCISRENWTSREGGPRGGRKNRNMLCYNLKCHFACCTIDNCKYVLRSKYSRPEKHHQIFLLIIYLEPSFFVVAFVKNIIWSFVRRQIVSSKDKKSIKKFVRNSQYKYICPRYF